MECVHKGWLTKSPPESRMKGPFKSVKWSVLILFLRATAVPAGTAEARISYGNSVCPSVCLSVRLSVCHDPVVYQAQIRDSGSSPYDSPESLVSYEVIWCHWVRGFPSNEGIKEGYPL